MHGSIAGLKDSLLHKVHKYYPKGLVWIFGPKSSNWNLSLAPNPIISPWDSRQHAMPVKADDDNARCKIPWHGLVPWKPLKFHHWWAEHLGCLTRKVAVKNFPCGPQHQSSLHGKTRLGKICMLMIWISWSAPLHGLIASKCWLLRSNKGLVEGHATSEPVLKRSRPLKPRWNKGRDQLGFKKDRVKFIHTSGISIRANTCMWLTG